MKRFRWACMFLATGVLLVFSAQAGAAKSQRNRVQKTAAPTWTLAMDGSRVAYASGDRIHVWDTATGKTTVVSGRYASKRAGVNAVAGRIAIAGKRVAWIRSDSIGNTEADEKLYTASIGGKARLVERVHRYGRDDPSLTTGGWIAGLVGAGKTLAVSTWRTDHGTPSAEGLSRIAAAGLQPIASGPGSIVAESADGGHIAALRSSVAWPTDSLMAVGPAPTVGVYSVDGTLLNEFPLTPPDGSTVGLEISLSGNQLIALRSELYEPSGPSTVTLEVYDWTTGQLLKAVPVGIAQDTGEVSFDVSGHLAAVEGPYRLHLVDLDTGKDVTIAPSSRTDCPPAIGPRGLVYTVNPHYNGPGKLVFVPTSRLLQLASS